MTVLCCLLIVALLLLLAAVLRAILNKPETEKGQPLPQHRLDIQAVAGRLAGAIRIPTVSYVQECDRSQWLAFHRYLEEQYPLLHQRLSREVIGEYGLLFHWEGTERNLDPMLLMAHMDVVPAASGTLDQWIYPPFSGTIADGYVWGRGCLDMKGSLIAICEACETLLQEGFVPKRSIYLSFGYDEELSGSGAKQIAQTLDERRVRLAFVLDEGGTVISGTAFGVDRPIATLGVSEKGYVDVILRAQGQGGHSSRPPKHTALGEICECVQRIERKPMNARIQSPTKDTLEALAPYAKPVYRLLFSNLWLFGWLVKLVFSRDPMLNAMIRTTFAATQAKASDAPNTLPDSAEVVEHLKKATGNKQLTYETMFPMEPSAITSVNHPNYRYLSSLVQRTFPEYIVAPYPMLGATDSVNFTMLSDCVVRFVPFRSFLEDAGSMHGVNERVSLESLEEGVQFFMHVMEQAEM